jgi:DNA polymerase
MTNELSAVYEELVRLKAEGEERIYIQDQTLEFLKPRPTAQPEQAQLSQELQMLVENTSSPVKNTQPQNSSTKASTTIGKPLPAQAPTVELPGGNAETRMAWLREKVENCPTCNEHLSRFGKIVFGIGNPSADIFFCGEAPGADEEKAGEPFVGPAGKLLTKIIQAMGLQRSDVYIGNILKWRPEHDKPYGNRPPTIEEMNFCLPYLRAQIEITQPKVIVALGNTAVSGLLGPDPKRKLSQIRGQWHTFGNIPLMITFHPSYLLRNGTMGTKRKVWEDMLKVMEKTGMEISDRQRGFFLPKD